MPGIAERLPSSYVPCKHDHSAPGAFKPFGKSLLARQANRQSGRAPRTGPCQLRQNQSEAKVHWLNSSISNCFGALSELPDFSALLSESTFDVLASSYTTSSSLERSRVRAPHSKASPAMATTFLRTFLDLAGFHIINNNKPCCLCGQNCKASHGCSLGLIADCSSPIHGRDRAACSL